MRLRGIAVNLVNQTIASTGIELKPLSRDFDSRFVSQTWIDRMCRVLAHRIDDFLADRSIFPRNVTVDLELLVKEFYESFVQSRYRLSMGGSRFANLLWLHVLRRTLGAELVIDSGTFTGASAWALSLGADRPVVHSFDIQLKLLAGREPNVTYHETDWTKAALPPVRAETTLAYFDDHIDQIRRTIEAHQRGLKYLIFDDDFTALAIPGNVPGAFALPKLTFLDDSELTQGDTISWYHRRRHDSYTIDLAYLDQARRLIGKKQRLPDFSDVLGIYQLPYTLVVLA